MKKIKLLAITPLLAILAGSLTSCSNEPSEVKIDNLDQGLQMLLDSISEKEEVSEFKSDRFLLQSSSCKKDNGDLVKSISYSDKVTFNYYENSFRAKNIHAVEVKSLELATSSSEEDKLTPIDQKNFTDIILKLDNNHNYLYTYQSNDKENEFVGDYYFDLAENNELTSYDKSMSFYLAKEMINSRFDLIKSTNEDFLDKVMEIIERKDDFKTLEFYQDSKNPGYIRFNAISEDSQSLNENNIYFQDGYVVKYEVFNTRKPVKGNGLVVEESSYSLSQFAYTADRFSNPKHKEFLNISIKDADEFPFLYSLVGFNEEQHFQ